MTTIHKFPPLFGTLLAGIRPLSAVRSQVFVVLGRIEKLFLTLLAGERFGLDMKVDHRMSYPETEIYKFESLSRVGSTC